MTVPSAQAQVSAEARPASAQPRRSLAARFLRQLVKAYRCLPRLRPPVCRYDPTCSEYAIAAIDTHGAMRGTWYFIRRLARCHPWGGFGFDPVPPRASKNRHPRTMQSKNHAIHKPCNPQNPT